MGLFRCFPMARNKSAPEDGLEVLFHCPTPAYVQLNLLAPRWQWQARPLSPAGGGRGWLKDHVHPVNPVRSFVFHLHWIMSAPLLAAGTTLRFMDTDHLSAPWTSPSLFFIAYEPSYTEPFYLREIVNHAHAILHSITRIQVIKPVTWKPITIEAEA